MSSGGIYGWLVCRNGYESRWPADSGQMGFRLPPLPARCGQAAYANEKARYPLLRVLVKRLAIRYYRLGLFPVTPQRPTQESIARQAGWARAFRAHAERVCDAKGWVEKRCPRYINGFCYNQNLSDDCILLCHVIGAPIFRVRLIFSRWLPIVVARFFAMRRYARDCAMPSNKVRSRLPSPSMLEFYCPTIRTRFGHCRRATSIMPCEELDQTPSVFDLR